MLALDSADVPKAAQLSSQSCLRPLFKLANSIARGERALRAEADMRARNLVSASERSAELAKWLRRAADRGC